MRPLDIARARWIKASATRAANQAGLGPQDTRRIAKHAIAAWVNGDSPARAISNAYKRARAGGLRSLAHFSTLTSANPCDTMHPLEPTTTQPTGLRLRSPQCPDLTTEAGPSQETGEPSQSQKPSLPVKS